MLVSYVIPALNSQKTLEKCLHGIFNQRPEIAFEIILVICTINQEETEILEKIGHRSNLTILYTSVKNRSYSRNLGAKVSKGEFLAFVDSDVLLDKKWLEYNLRPFSNKLVAASQGSFTIDSENISNFDIHYGFRPQTYQCMLSPFGPVIVTGACIYRRSIFFRLGLFDNRVFWNEDLNLSVTAFYNGYALSYQEKANAILLNKSVNMAGRLKRSFVSGQYHYHIIKHKFTHFSFVRNSKIFTGLFIQSIKNAWTGHGNRGVHLLGSACHLMKWLGMSLSFLFATKRQVYSFPVSGAEPYLGFKNEFREQYKDFGVVLVNDKRLIINIKTGKIYAESYQ